MRSERAFTLVEVMVALGVLAIGLTSALALLAAATGAQKRAVDRATSAAIAASALAEAEGRVTAVFDETALPVHPEAQATRVLESDRVSVEHDGYRYDLLLTPIDPDETPAQAFLAEAVVRWSEKGAARESTYQTVIVRRIAAGD